MASSKHYRPSDDVQLPTDCRQLYDAARLWVDTAAQHLKNEEYWKARALQAETELKLERLRHKTR